MRPGPMASIVAGLLMALATASAAQAGCRLGRLAELPLEARGGRIVVRGAINGGPVDFTVDSGSFYSYLGPATAKALGLELSLADRGFRIQGVTGGVDAAVTFVKVLKLGDTTLPRMEFVVGGTGATQENLLGQNILRIADVEYDVAGGALRLFRPHDCGSADLAYWAKDGRYSIVRLAFSSDAVPYTELDVLVNGVPMRAMIDTGAPRTVMTLRAAARLGLQPGGEGVRPAGLTRGLAGRAQPMWTATLKDIQVGDELIRTPHIAMADLKMADADLLLGLDFVRAHRLLVAGSQGRLYFSYIGGQVFPGDP